jgi:hypothetical protein
MPLWLRDASKTQVSEARPGPLVSFVRSASCREPGVLSALRTSRLKTSLLDQLLIERPVHACWGQPVDRVRFTLVAIQVLSCRGRLLRRLRLRILQVTFRASRRAWNRARAN